MEMLFAKQNTGELHDILGFSDADIDTAKIWPYLRSQSREMQKIIGKENYSIAVAQYSNEYELLNGVQKLPEDAEDLLELLKYAIALGALREYAPLLDVSITNDGRLFRRDDHQVGAFEWQIDRNNREMERNYYRAVDELIAFIIESDTLEQSDYMLQFSGLYVPDLATFQNFVNINNSHLLYYKLAPALRLCEQREIMNRLGSKFFEYKDKKNDFITTLVQQCCVYFAMADGIQKLSLQLFPEGLMKGEAYSQKAASGYDKESATLYYRNELTSLFKMLESEVRKLNPTVYIPRTNNFCEGDGFVSV